MKNIFAKHLRGIVKPPTFAPRFQNNERVQVKDRTK